MDNASKHLLEYLESRGFDPSSTSVNICDASTTFIAGTLTDGQSGREKVWRSTAQTFATTIDTAHRFSRGKVCMLTMQTTGGQVLHQQATYDGDKYFTTSAIGNDVAAVRRAARDASVVARTLT